MCVASLFASCQMAGDRCYRANKQQINVVKQRKRLAIIIGRFACKKI